LRQAVAQAEVFAVRSGVLADQGDFAGAGSGKIFRFAYHRFKSAAAELSAQLRNDAEGAGVIAAFRDFDVRGVLRSGEDARCQIVIEKRRRRHGHDAHIPVNGFNDALDFAGADDRVDFGNLLENLVAIAFDQASSNDQFFGRAEFFVFGHFQNGVDGFFLRGFDEAAGVDDQDVGFVGARGQFVAVMRQKAHHHLAIDEVFVAAQTDESDLRHGENCALSQFSIVARAVGGPARGSARFETPACRFQCERSSARIVPNRCCRR
jgi:hypothetical protein